MLRMPEEAVVALSTEAPDRLLDRVRKLLAKAEAEGVTVEEAQALTAKAAELMAKYGIDRALLAAARPETDKPDNRIVEIYNPWARVQAHLLCGLAAALRCQCILLPASEGQRVHVFGYGSDIERADVLYTSVLIQMWHGLTAAQVPAWSDNLRAWRRSWLLGYAAAVIAKVRDAEQRRRAGAASEGPDRGSSRAALVLADRSLVIRQHVARAYPVTRTARVTYTGNGYGAGYAQGKRADIGAGRVGQRRARALTKWCRRGYRQRRRGERAACGRNAERVAPISSTPEVREPAAPEQRQEDRVGAVPVRPELRVPAGRPALRSGTSASTAGASSTSMSVARGQHVRDNILVSARCGEQVT